MPERAIGEVAMIELKHDLPAGVKGYTQFNDARDYFNIVLTENSDESTFMHESAHVFLELNRLAVKHENVTPRMLRDMALTEKFLGAEPGAEFTTEQHEKFARAWELYLREGRAPSIGLAGVFERFEGWMKEAYPKAEDLNVELDDDIRGVFDRMLATDEQIAEARIKFVQRLATDKELAEAQYNLGLMYDNSEGVPEDFVLAYMWVNLAGANGYDVSKAKEMLASRMTQADISKAQELTRQYIKGNPGVI
jgi:TPR repeat protein